MVPATQEVEIARTVDPHGQKFSQTTSQPTSWVWWCTPVIPTMREVYWPAQGKNARHFLKNN
jgi:hypothetical protein